MNTATQIGLAILVIIAFSFLVAGWFAVCWLIQSNLEAKYKRCLPFSGLALYLSPVVGIGLICLCYGLVVQPKTTEPKEETVTKEEHETLNDMVSYLYDFARKQDDDYGKWAYITAKLEMMQVWLSGGDLDDNFWSAGPDDYKGIQE